jgi:hypothetical protein
MSSGFSRVDVVSIQIIQSFHEDKIGNLLDRSERIA